jgi:hypothetical protein
MQISRALAVLLAAGYFIGMPADAVTILGSGVYTCGKWVAERESDGKPLLVKWGWVLGYLSGLASASQRDVLAPVDADSIALWMDNYCRAHPLDHVEFAARTLFDELSARAKR